MLVVRLVPAYRFDPDFVGKGMELIALLDIFPCREYVEETNTCVHL